MRPGNFSWNSHEIVLVILSPGIEDVKSLTDSTIRGLLGGWWHLPTLKSTPTSEIRLQTCLIPHQQKFEPAKGSGWDRSQKLVTKVLCKAI